jgi:hypothetical protein
LQCPIIDVGLDSFHLLFDAVVHLFDERFLLLVLPVEGIGLMLVVQVVDAPIGLNIVGNLLRLSIIDLLHFSEVLHVHLVPHLIVDDVGGAARVYH